jgi:CubicO group peptidase (beta-lactamase class C family)
VRRDDDGHHLLVPSGLQHTFVEAEETWSDPTATGYFATTAGPMLTDTTGLYHASQVGPSGAIVATVGDLRAWIAALLIGDVLAPESQAELVSFVPAGGADYGLGIFQVEGDGVLAVGHNGAVMGFQAAAFVHPDTTTSVAVMHNQLTIDDAGGLANDPTTLALELIAALADGV